MSEFFSDLSEGLSDIIEDLTPWRKEKDSVELLNKGQELNEGEQSWLENLVDRIVEPVKDFFDGDGYDTERINPKDGGELPEEGIEAHDVEEAAEEWHVQDGDNSCAVCTQQFIINEFLDLDLTEEELCDFAEEQGWYEPELGTMVKDMSKLLEAYGIDTQTNSSGSIQDIKNTLDEGGRVIIAVDAMVLWTEGFGTYPVYGADHAIEVIGIDDSDPLDVRVIVNDSGRDDGCGRSLSYLEFMECWSASGGFMVSAFPKD